MQTIFGPKKRFVNPGVWTNNLKISMGEVLRKMVIRWHCWEFSYSAWRWLSENFFCFHLIPFTSCPTLTLRFELGSSVLMQSQVGALSFPPWPECWSLTKKNLINQRGLKVNRRLRLPWVTKIVCAQRRKVFSWPSLSSYSVLGVGRYWAPDTDDLYLL